MNYGKLTAGTTKTAIDTVKTVRKGRNHYLPFPNGRCSSDGIPWVSEGVAAFKSAENVEAAKYFIEWLFSNDDHLRQLASIENKTGVKIIKPSIEGVELTYDASILMDEDLSLFGKQREEILARFEPMMGDKAAQE